jgi:hypothetical protein
MRTKLTNGLNQLWAGAMATGEHAADARVSRQAAERRRRWLERQIATAPKDGR